MHEFEHEIMLQDNKVDLGHPRKGRIADPLEAEVVSTEDNNVAAAEVASVVADAPAHLSSAFVAASGAVDAGSFSVLSPGGSWMSRSSDG